MEIRTDIKGFQASELGVYAGLSDDDYHAHDALSNSRLGQFRASPRKMRYNMEHPESTSTSAKIFGRAAHASLLEAERFSKEFVTAQQCAAITKQGSRCTKQGSRMDSSGAWYCGLKSHAPEEAYVPDQVITEAEEVALQKMSAWCHTLPVTRRLLVDENGNDIGPRELSILWKCQGVLCKARVDLLCVEKGFALDYKTTRGLEGEYGVTYWKTRNDWELTTSRSIFNYGYHRQGAFYTDALAYHKVFINNFVFLVQEKTPPYECAPLSLHSDAIRLGREEYEPEVLDYAECLKENKWPPATPQKIIEVDLPQFAYGSDTKW